MNDQKLNILIVEDDDLDRMIMKKALNSSGFKLDLHFAEDHESGTIAAKERIYDCIFLDYNLPGGTGLEILKSIRREGITSPIIIVTSQGDEKIAVEAMKNGANDYIPKGLLSTDGVSQSLRYVLKLRENELERIRLQNKLEETQRNLQTVVSNSPIILFALDKTGHFTLFEGRGIDPLGIEPSDLVGKPISYCKDMLPISEELFENAMSGNSDTVIAQVAQEYFEIFYSPIRNENNEIAGAIGVATDVTTHKSAEEQLRKAKQLAEEMAAVKEQFLANMSHEIRTPMNGIIGLTKILMKTPISDEQFGYLNSIKTCSDTLLVIINDILDLSKIEAGKMNFESVPFRLADLSNHTIELFRNKAAEKSLYLKLEVDQSIPPALSGDPTRLSQIMNNLVSNAIKFTEEGGITLRITAKTTSQDKITLHFEVEDTGIGIPESSLATIFDSFTQASTDTTRKFGGTGLGLTIVKQLIELQGGSIGVSSALGQGTNFFFHLTFQIADDTTIKTTDEQTDQPMDLNGLRILIAEDNHVNQLIVKKLMQDWKADVDFAENGRIAIEKLTASKYDLVLMDIQMPEMNGYTATENIRQLLPEPAKSVPIMAMTAHATPTERQKCYDSGMNDYISKPFDPNELRKKIIELTNSGSATYTDVNAQFKNGKAENNPMYQSSQQNPVSGNNGINHNLRTSLQTPNLYIENKGSSRPQPDPDALRINLTFLKQIADGNDTFIIEMIEMFLNKTPAALEEMNEYFKQQNWQELRQIAHRIKPSYTYVGLPDIQQTLAEIEQLTENNPPEPSKVGDLIAAVDSASRSIFSQLKQELSTMR